MSALPKPVLRGHIKRRGLKGLIGAMCLAAFNGTVFHFTVCVPRREAYENFLKTYDPIAHYKDLVRWNYISFQEALNELKGGS